MALPSAAPTKSGHPARRGSAHLRCPQSRTACCESRQYPAVPLAPKVRGRQVEELISPPVNDSLNHVKGEAFRHLERDGWRHGQFRSGYNSVDQDRPLMGERAGDTGFDLAW